MYLEHGIMTTEELRAIGHYPSEERMRKGPVAGVRVSAADSLQPV